MIVTGLTDDCATEMSVEVPVPDTLDVAVPELGRTVTGWGVTVTVPVVARLVDVRCRTLPAAVEVVLRDRPAAVNSVPFVRFRSVLLVASTLTPTGTAGSVRTVLLGPLLATELNFWPDGSVPPWTTFPAAPAK